MYSDGSSFEFQKIVIIIKTLNTASDKIQSVPAVSLSARRKLRRMPYDASFHLQNWVQDANRAVVQETFAF